MKIDGECLIELIGSCRNKVQVYRSVRMPQLHTSPHFHLTPIVMINGSYRRDILLDSQNFCRSIPAGTENPLLSRLCYRRLWGSRHRRALILGWAYYLDAFSSYPLRTWLPSVYRGHDNCQAPFCLCTRGPISVRPEETFARLRYLLGGLRPIETVYLRLSLGPAVASGTRTLARGIFSTPSYPKVTLRP
ncbi:hypothetical protein C5167_031211 [Papaver somniferum]|nr:hypothetical protein C5167_031211 [Papaver somniferum]